MAEIGTVTIPLYAHFGGQDFHVGDAEFKVTAGTPRLADDGRSVYIALNIGQES